MKCKCIHTETKHIVAFPYHFNFMKICKTVIGQELFFSVSYSKRALDLWQFRITILVYRQNLIIPDIAHSDMLSVPLVAVKIYRPANN